MIDSYQNIFELILKNMLCFRIEGQDRIYVVLQKVDTGFKWYIVPIGTKPVSKFYCNTDYHGLYSC